VPPYQVPKKIFEEGGKREGRLMPEKVFPIFSPATGGGGEGKVKGRPFKSRVLFEGGQKRGKKRKKKKGRNPIRMESMNCRQSPSGRGKRKKKKKGNASPSPEAPEKSHRGGEGRGELNSRPAYSGPQEKK